MKTWKVFGGGLNEILINAYTADYALYLARLINENYCAVQLFSI